MNTTLQEVKSPNYKYNIITEILHIALTRVKGHRISRLTDIIYTYTKQNSLVDRNYEIISQ